MSARTDIAIPPWHEAYQKIVAIIINIVEKQKCFSAILEGNKILTLTKLSVSKYLKVEEVAGMASCN